MLSALSSSFDCKLGSLATAAQLDVVKSKLVDIKSEFEAIKLQLSGVNPCKIKFQGALSSTPEHYRDIIPTIIRAIGLPEYVSDVKIIREWTYLLRVSPTLPPSGNAPPQPMPQLPNSIRKMPETSSTLGGMRSETRLHLTSLAKNFPLLRSWYII